MPDTDIVQRLRQAGLRIADEELTRMEDLARSHDAAALRLRASLKFGDEPSNVFRLPMPQERRS
ncbi:MAG: hypothetical protein JWP20_420 [Roseomonas sp.]|jgi:hypothetical protein|nr:hypothetical protein [Roseomonas sp.]